VTDEEKNLLVWSIREKARILYEGREVAHRSCGIALAEAFNLPTRPYQALRRGGISGEGFCGAVVAGQLVLGEYLGYPDPTAPVSLQLREAMAFYNREIDQRLDRGGSPTLACNDLVRAFPLFHSDERVDFCTAIVAVVAEVVAQVLLHYGVQLEATPIAGT
jgi:hypothetical protein